MRTTTFMLTLLLLSAGCGGDGVDWWEPETLIRREKSATTDDGVQLRYWSLLDAPCRKVYDALTDVEHYPEFIPGIDSVQLLGQTENSKTVLMGQRVVSRMANAKVEWTFGRDPLRVDFKTLTSDFAFNDGSYTFEPSPDGTRCLVHFTFLTAGVAGEAREVGWRVGERWTDHPTAFPFLAMACGAVLDEQRTVGVLALAGSPRARRDDEGRDRDGDQASIDRRLQRSTPRRASI